MNDFRKATATDSRWYWGVISSNRKNSRVRVLAEITQNFGELHIPHKNTVT